MRYKVNDLLGKAVINQTSGERLAKVSDVVFAEDMQAAIALLISGGGLFSQPLVIRWGAVQSIGDVIVAQSAAAFPKLSDDTLISGLREQNTKISGTPLIGTDGQRAGTITDTLINERGQVVGYEVDPGGLFIGRKFLPAAHVQKVGKDALIATDTTLQSLKDTAAEVGDTPSEH